MRRILLAVALFVSALGVSQEMIINSEQGKYEFYVSPSLTGDVLEYFSHEEVYELDLTPLEGLHSINIVTNDQMISLLNAYSWDSIYLGLTKYLPTGVTGVFINDILPVYIPQMYEIILYHEMYHVFLGEETANHCQEEECPEFLKAVWDKSTAVCGWGEEAKKNYFKYLKEKQDE